MKHEIPHDLDMKLAKNVAAHAFEEYARRFEDYAPKLEWADDRNAQIEFQIKGLRLQGKIGIRPGAIMLDLEVPFMLRIFKKRAIDVIDREVRAWIDKARAGKLAAAPPG